MILVATLTLAVFVLTSYTILNSVIDNTDDSMIDQSVLENAQSALTVYDMAIPFVNMSFYIVGIILAAKIRASPVFALPAIFFLGISVWLSAELANIYGLFGQTPVLSEAASTFTFTATFFSNIPWITLGMGAALLVTLYTVIGGRSEVTV